MAKHIDVVQDRQGNAIAGASVTVYLTGTLTLATLTDDNDAALANPVTTDADGEYEFNVDPGAYDLKVTNAGIVDKTLVGVEVAAGAGGGGGGGSEYLVENFNGALPTAAGADALALGESAAAGFVSAIAVGRGARSRGDYGIAVGDGADNGGAGANPRGIAIGQDSFALGAESIAIGSATVPNPATRTDAPNSIAIGSGAQVGSDTHTGSVVIGMATSDAANQVVLADGQGNVFLRTGLNGAPAEHADDAAAATGGVPIGGFYRTGSVLKVRVS